MTVKVSSKYQVVIPEGIRKSFGVRPGQEFEVMEDEGQLILVPVKSFDELRGILKGAKAEGYRDKKDRF